MSESNKLVRNIEQQMELLMRHAEILSLLVKNKKPMGILRLSKKTGYPPHQVRYSLKELQNAKIIDATTKGAKLKKEAPKHLSKIQTDLSELHGSLGEFNSYLGNMEI